MLCVRLFRSIPFTSNATVPAVPFSEQIAKASVLIEAMPYLQRFRGQTFLIKFGGSAMDDPELVEMLLRDVVFLELAGINPVVVHGGGKAISKAMADAGLTARFVGGLRVTDERTISIVEDTLHGVINRDLVDTINRFGGRAVGLPGKSVFIGHKNQPVKGEDGSPVDLGFVGTVHGFHAGEVLAAIHREQVPVISPLASEEGTGAALNVNADIAAASLAGKLRAAKFVYISDVRGVMLNPADDTSLIPSLTASGVERLINERVITGGMIPKVRSALQALADGVQKVHMIDGRIPHSLLLEIFTEHGIGTEIAAA
ncbi:MAG: acetylglutamate kinase [Verrucomicrobiales bacterium]|nr:acetylglutamate kinase [Verrucomicrobiales bacterium]